MILSPAVFLLLVWLVYRRFPGALVGCFNRAVRMMGGIKWRETFVDNCRWVYLDGGRGETILLLHGFGADKDRFWTFIPALSRSYRVIAPDLPGFGESSRLPQADHGIPRQAERLNGFIQSLGLESFHLAGISMGGAVAAYYAGEYPERVKSLFLMAPLSMDSLYQSRASKKFFEEGVNIFRCRTVAEFDALIRNLFYKPPWIPGRFKEYFLKKSTADQAVRDRIMQDLLGSGLDLLEARLERIKAEALVLWGKEDAILDVSAAEKMRARIPRCRLVVLENCGHVPFYEKRKETIRSYRTFLHSAGSAP
ncbi:MAG: alpha/beta hydrolase [Desulfobacteraceae bacterium]|nr:MAG: alpha/beta hydrolase [Desulfobacteraceae bacterium]